MQRAFVYEDRFIDKGISLEERCSMLDPLDRDGKLTSFRCFSSKKSFFSTALFLLGIFVVPIAPVTRPVSEDFTIPRTFRERKNGFVPSIFSRDPAR